MLGTDIAKLAINGGKPIITESLPKFNTIGKEEAQAAYNAVLRRPLSGYLGGECHGGYFVEKLEGTWEEIFGVKHAIAVNSATSGLLIACLACRKQWDTVLTTPYTMSATAAAPLFANCDIEFGDIEDDTFSLIPSLTTDQIRSLLNQVIITNLFGHPAHLRNWRQICNTCDISMIEDNAQSIFAKEDGHYAGTIGHIGVFSLNVHKHLQCGEGGICVTNDDALADWMRLRRNHGCMAGGKIGLNLRMTEVTAAIALVQLEKRRQIMSERIELAESIIDAAKPLFEPPVVREKCTHSYYMIAWKAKQNRDKIVEALKAEGMPVKAGYLKPLYHLPAFSLFPFETQCPVAERVESELVTYENCGYSPTSTQLKQMREAFQKVAGGLLKSAR